MMKFIGKLLLWLVLWAGLVFQPVFGDPPESPRIILSVQESPPIFLPTPMEEKQPKPAMPIYSKEDTKVLDFHLTTETMAVDLATVLRLAGLDNPQILLARQRVLEAVA